MAIDKEDLREVYQNTVEHCLSVDSIDFTIPKPLYYDTDTLDDKLLEEDIKPRFDSMKVFVENDDSFSLASKLLEEGITTGDKMTVLNCASHKHPGGGVENGAKAQEECLFRCSNYFLHLPPAMYPLFKNDVILSRNVYVFKNALDEYKFLDKPFYVNCLAIAARAGPKTTKVDGIDMYRNEADYKLMQQKIEDVFRVAYLNNQEVLILGALGCGAFGNPVYVVAEIFIETLKKYNNCFKTVAFAVLSFGQNQNYKIFKTHVEVAFNS